ncbi:DUF3775 domain-containing protein [Pseudoprimorskyibacter insulae]|uniref:DUF3775 domain-containing protein n=1 Tax=Pseudoprimorskyibacter insulae TaxID=1695997 RepID=A0A2R8AUK9_9RHOB|nr:DUF3775 domain-containing protein [Pseudoprimorskyibacter insulae]SPF79670.1 hypothetical protein PRI8871_01467 [Pseudoprimorskyibacter insulae]
MKDISSSKVAQIILMGRELHRAEGEMRAFIDGLNEDEAVALVAIMWIGRGSFDAEEWDEAVATAKQEASTPTADYLIGTPHLPDHLENGMEALGVAVADAEDDLMMRGS